jgi:hypothetical protein
VKRLRLWTYWDFPFLAALFLASWFAGRAALGPPGVATGLKIQAPAGSRLEPLRPGRLEIHGHLGTHLLEVAEDGSIRILRAPCPSQLCKTLGPVSRAGQALICVPNQILVELTGSLEGPTLDGVTR